MAVHDAVAQDVFLYQQRQGGEVLVHEGEVVGGLEIHPVFLDDLVEVQKLFPGIFHGLIHEGAVKVVERDLAVK